MKKVMIVSLLLLAICMAGTANAALWTGTVNDGIGDSFFPVQTFVWGAGAPGTTIANGDAIGLGPAGTPLSVGTTFTFLYQAPLASLITPGGTTLNTPGNGTTWEYTVVASINETVTDFRTTGTTQTVQFSTQGGSFVLMQQNPADANLTAGTGFTDGTIAATGTISPSPFSGNFSFTPGSTGFGSSLIDGLVTSANPDLLIPAAIIFDFHFQGTQNFPIGGFTAPPLFFGGTNNTGNAAFNTYTVNTSTTAPSDLLLSVVGNSDFTVPEPSTLLLVGAGLLGVAGLARRRKAQK